MTSIYKPGKEVKLVDGDIRARVIKASINEAGVEYLVVWWNGRERKEVWVTDGEICTATRSHDLQIGFKNG